jgi:cobalt-zinc-cadmium resistance protein CzcA
VGTVSKALMEATVLVLCCWGLFSATCVRPITVAMVLPLSALATFILMRTTGMSANLMSLGGLAIALGMLVDAAVVVVENVVQHLATTRPRRSCRACTSCSAPCARWRHRCRRAC